MAKPPDKKGVVRGNLPGGSMLKRFSDNTDVFPSLPKEVKKPIPGKGTASKNVVDYVNVGPMGWSSLIHQKMAYERKLQLIGDFVSKHPGEDVLPLVRRCFPDTRIGEAEKKAAARRALISKTLPREAPEIWKASRENGETPPQFIKRVYEPWLGHGLSRADVRRLDPGLYRALYNWAAQPGHDISEDLDLPTRIEQNDRTLNRAEGDPNAGLFTLREAARLLAAADRRKYKK